MESLLTLIILPVIITMAVLTIAFKKDREPKLLYKECPIKRER